MSNPQTIRTHGGVELRLSDSDPNISLTTPTGTTITVNETEIRINAGGSTLRIAGGIVSIDAAQIQFDAPIVSARLIRCDTIVAQSVVGTSYTPGAGNIM